MSNDRSLLTRALWFLAIGWWATPVLIEIAWVLNLTIVGIPLGIKLINLVPTALTLKERRRYVEPQTPRQHSLLVRLVYFVFVGWWLSFLWANVAAFLAVTIVGLPIAIWMFNRLPYVTSLYRFEG